jgi:hypothetical protein
MKPPRASTAHPKKRPPARPQPKKHKKVVVSRTPKKAHPKLERRRVKPLPAGMPVLPARSDSTPILLSLVLGIALGLSLLLVAVALTPSRVLPGRMVTLVYDRRPVLIFGGFALAFSIALAMTLAVS